MTLAAQNDAPVPPELANFAPTVDAEQPIGDLAAALGGILSARPIFLRNGTIVAVNHEGEMEAMVAERFTSWIEQYCEPVRETKKGTYPASIGKDRAGQVLNSDQFRRRLRKITAVRPVRMPVVRVDGTLELLPQGYDEATGNYTVGAVDYPQDWTAQQAVVFFEGELKTWPWEDMEKTIGDSPSALGILMCMCMQYCDAMLREGQRRPALAVDANQAGSGKTTIAKMVLCPVHGLPNETDLPEDKAELMKLLQSAALDGSPYLMLDDIGVFVKSPALNKFITASYHGGRMMHKQRQFRVPNVTQVYMTGNMLQLSTDQVRRAVIAKLFVAGEVQGREFGHVISDDYLALEETRAKYLAAMWALVRHAHAQHPLHHPGRVGKRARLQTFERWCDIGQRILESIPLFTADPLSPSRALASTGNRDDLEMRAMLIALADRVEGEYHEYTREDMVARAREMGVLEYLVGCDGDGDLRSNDKIRFGRRLEPWLGRQMARTDGKIFEFGRARKRDKSEKAKVYPFRIM